MQPIGNVVFIQGDITSARTQEEISTNMDQSKASLIVCDGAPPNQGIFNTTYFMQNKLLDSCLQVVNALIKDGGHFVSKIFIDDQKDIFYSQFILDKFKPFFSDVEIYKPDSSRNSSNENFVICRKFRSKV
ncbi:MAG: hypothetical protein MHMPM18_004946 [Marteilia pararefringens]